MHSIHGRERNANDKALDLDLVPWYINTMTDQPFVIERVQTGVRIEKRLLKVLKAVAELNDLTLGDLLEGIVLHAFDGKLPFSPDSLERIADFKRLYGLELDSSASHRLREQSASVSSAQKLNPKQKR